MARFRHARVSKRGRDVPRITRPAITKPTCPGRRRRLTGNYPGATRALQEALGIHSFRDEDLLESR